MSDVTENTNTAIPMPRRLRALIADDEPAARKRLADLLHADEDFGEVLVAADGGAAISAINEKNPDIVFLDVQMPEVDGFGVIDAIGADRMPLTIFVTGSSSAARKAWDYGAVDCLLKPFGDKRFEAAVQRAKGRLSDAGPHNLVA